MTKKQKWIAGTLGVIVALPILFVIVLFNNNGLQDRLATRAVDTTIAQQFARSQSYGGDNLDIVFCGTASPMGATDRAQQCIAVLAGDKFFIVDTGARSAAKANEAGLPLGALDGILLTHFHSDHISAMGEFHLQSWAQGRAQKLAVYGGPGVERVVDGFNLAYGQDYTYRTEHHTEALMPSATAGLVAKPFGVPATGTIEIFNQDGLTIKAFRVPHEPVRPAVGYRFDYKGRSVSISGDASKSLAIAEASKGVDVLIHEVLQPELVNLTSRRLKLAGNDRLSGIVYDTLDYHTSPVEAAEIANFAEASLLVFTHFAPAPANASVERIFMRGVDDVRGDGVLLADDGLHVRLPIGASDISILVD